MRDKKITLIFYLILEKLHFFYLTTSPIKYEPWTIFLNFCDYFYIEKILKMTLFFSFCNFKNYTLFLIKKKYFFSFSKSFFFFCLFLLSLFVLRFFFFFHFFQRLFPFFSRRGLYYWFLHHYFKIISGCLRLKFSCHLVFYI